MSRPTILTRGGGPCLALLAGAAWLACCTTLPPEGQTARAPEAPQPAEQMSEKLTDPRSGPVSAGSPRAGNSVPADPDPAQQQRWAMRADDQRDLEAGRAAEQLRQQPPSPAAPPPTGKPSDPADARTGTGSPPPPPGAPPPASSRPARENDADRKRAMAEAAAPDPKAEAPGPKLRDEAKADRAIAIPRDTELWIIQRPRQGRAHAAAALTKEKDAFDAAGLGAVRLGAKGELVRQPLTMLDGSVRAQVNGVAAQVVVRQKFSNPFPEAVEAVYMLRLPDDAAVCDFVMTVGKRQIRAVVRERAEAAEIYSQAVRQGHAAVLLASDGDNLFTQNIGNIPAGGEVDVAMTYFQGVPYVDGAFELALPGGMRGTSPLELTIEPGAPLASVASPTHPVNARMSHRGTRAEVSLAAGGPASDGEIRVRWETSGGGVRLAGSAASAGEGERYFNLAVLPPADADLPAARGINLVFLLDRSPTLGDAGFRIADSLVGAAEHMTTPGESAKADVVARLDMDPAAPALQAQRLLAEMPADGRRRQVVLLTDGRFPGALDLLAALQRQGARTSNRFSVVAIGPSPDLAVCSALARAGRGRVIAATSQEAATPAAWSLLLTAGRPALTNVRIDVVGSGEAEVYPSVLPDLVAGRSLSVSGRITGGGATDPVRVKVTGDWLGERRTYEIELPITAAVASEPTATSRLWARRAVAEMCSYLPLATDAPAAARARALALRHGVVSGYTALICVDAVK